MTLLGALVVTAVVWAVSVIRPVRWRALVYSLPVPMTVALTTTGTLVDGAQVMGVGALVLFFVTVTVTHHRLRWHIALADAVGIAAYVLASWLILRAGPIPFWPATLAMAALWTLTMLVLRRRPAPNARTVPSAGVPAWAKPFVIFAGALVTMLFGQALRGLVVTFPYAGVLTAVETRRHLPAFTRHVVRNSLPLVGFLAGYQSGQHVSPLLAVGGGWATFGGLVAALSVATRVTDARPCRWRQAVSLRSTRMAMSSRGDSTEKPIAVDRSRAATTSAE